MLKNCTKCTTSFEITGEDVALLGRLSPVVGGCKLALPAPTLCPRCRQIRRLVWRNERNLHNRTCDLTGRSLISNFSPDKPYKVYDQKDWWTDAWDGRTVGQVYDFSRPFFAQFQELMLKTAFPHVVSSIDMVESNCIYTNYAGNNKDCYLVFDSDFNEHGMYSDVLKHSLYCLDCSYVVSSEKCYECVDCEGSYNLYYSQDCVRCSDSYFLKNCQACRDCIGCYNLQQKQYCIDNEQYSKTEYEQKKNTLNLGNKSALQKIRQTFCEKRGQYPVKYYHGIQTEESNGDYLSNTKNVTSSYNMHDARDCRYCDSMFFANDCLDVSSFGEKAELVYESGTIGINVQSIYFGHGVASDVSNVIYSIYCRNSQNLFGCANLKRNQYCILNKQYSQLEYENLVPKIVEHMRSTGEWGEYFPASLSPFGYNETVAQDIYPLVETAARAQEYNWSNYEPPALTVEKTIPGNRLPDEIKDVPDDILNWAIECEVTKKPFKIIKSELDFYRQNNLPVPRRHPVQRFHDRLVLRNPRVLWDRHCAACNQPLKTTYAPERPERILCEECYLKEVY